VPYPLISLGSASIFDGDTMIFQVEVWDQELWLQYYGDTHSGMTITPATAKEFTIPVTLDLDSFPSDD
jgi:hypothetical protein